jgi:hypothetical protein
MVARIPRACGVAAAALLFCCLSCASRVPDPLPETGIVTVGVTTTGPNVVSLVFRVDLEPAGIGGAIKADAGIFTARNTPVGNHVVRLTEVPARCRIDGGAERTVSVSPRRSTTVRFVIACK